MYDPEAIYQDADFEQAEMEEEGRRYWRRVDRMNDLRAEGRLVEAAAICPHGSGYPLNSLAAIYTHDPREGEDGYRCSTCGSALTDAPWNGGTVTHPCEL